MNQLVLFAAAAESGSGNIVADIASKFGVTLPLFISQLIAFVVVAILLKRFAYQPILMMLEKRRQRIAESMTNAYKIKQELASTEAARKEVLEKANVQANKLIEQARAAAAQVQERESRKAIAQAEQIIRQAREAAAADHAKMLVDLKQEIGGLVVKTTTQVIGKALTPEDQKRLVEEANRELASS
ncbi:MAG: ATP synthase subunit b [Verrucomicrobia subdivision 3 bacterium]|nr:ATP synthase subunit b [Limisphaerales bacterium]MCS1415460.1 ATP synthase subunit b [Limisphaerales bacterium]